MKGKFAVVIPAFNEAATIGNLLESVSMHADLIVVDDGSKDETASISRNYGAAVLSHKKNQGYDAALETGIRFAKSQGYAFVLTMDADGQHDPETIAVFKENFIDGIDLVIGVRKNSQRFSEYIFSKVAKILWGINDPLCGMKGFRLEKIPLSLRFNTYRSIGTELTIRLVRSGHKFSQVKVPIRARNDSSRFGGGILANLKILKSLVLGIKDARPKSTSN